MNNQRAKAYGMGLFIRQETSFLSIELSGGEELKVLAGYATFHLAQRLRLGKLLFLWRWRESNPRPKVSVHESLRA